MQLITILSILWFTLSSTAQGIEDTSSKEPFSPEIDYIKINPPAGFEWLFGRTVIRVIYSEERDFVYDLGRIKGEPWGWIYALTGRPTLGYSRSYYQDFLDDIRQQGASLSVRRLALPRDIRLNMAKQLEDMAKNRTYLYRVDPLRNNSSRQCAELLDRVMNGQLAQQTSLRLRGSRRSWILERLKPHTIMWLLADLYLRPLDQGTLTVWDTTFLPDGLQRTVDRASYQGLPIVDARYREGTPKPIAVSHWPNIPIWVWGLPILFLARWQPRLATFLGASLLGTLGLVAVMFQLGPAWYGVADSWYILVLPSTHLLLALLSGSSTLWGWSIRYRILYLILSLSLTLTLFVISIFGGIPPVSNSAVLTNVLINIGLLFGYQHERRTARLRRGTAIDIRPRATSAIERHSSYVRPGGLRLR